MTTEIEVQLQDIFSGYDPFEHAIKRQVGGEEVIVYDDGWVERDGICYQLMPEVVRVIKQWDNLGFMAPMKFELIPVNSL